MAKKITPGQREQWIEYFSYLDNLRESGETNMYGAGSYLQQVFEELDQDNSKTVLLSWMKHFSDKPVKQRVMDMLNEA